MSKPAKTKETCVTCGHPVHATKCLVRTYPKKNQLVRCQCAPPKPEAANETPAEVARCCSCVHYPADMLNPFAPCTCSCHAPKPKPEAASEPAPSPAFSELESAVLQRLEKGPLAFTPLWLGLQSPLTRSDPNFFRKVDRALQKLRRGGFVHTDRRVGRVGWSLK
jgi:hypothetical protein